MAKNMTACMSVTTFVGCVLFSVLSLFVSCADPPRGIRSVRMTDAGLQIIACPGMQADVDYSSAKASKIVLSNSSHVTEDITLIETINDESPKIKEVVFLFHLVSPSTATDGEYLIEVFGYLNSYSKTASNPETLIDSVRITILQGVIVVD